MRTVATTAAANRMVSIWIGSLFAGSADAYDYKRLQQHDLSDAGDAVRRQCGIEDEERGVLADEADIAEPKPRRICIGPSVDMRCITTAAK